MLCLSLTLSAFVPNGMRLFINHFNVFYALKKCLCFVKSRPLCFFMFMDSCISISIIGQQGVTIYSLLYFCILLYMFWVVTPPIIRSTYNCNYGIWHWSKPSLLPFAMVEKLELKIFNCSTIAEGSRDRLTSDRCRNYIYKCCWWWVELPPETCRAVYRNIINCI
jgi:hypothetical protein